METITGKAKVQMMGDIPFIYLPKVECKKKGVRKGVKVHYFISYDGSEPEPIINRWKKGETHEKKEIPV